MTAISHTNKQPRNESVLRWSGIALVATVWTSAILFGLYILIFYAAALFGDDMSRWNSVLPGLYDSENLTATLGIGIHFAAGGLILILGSIQLIEIIRDRYPRLHRRIGRVYVGASIITAIGGLIFIAVSGTVGGTVMDIGFGLYGILMFTAALQTIHQARAGQMESHNLWAWRLYALAIGSWLYRMDYGFWYILTGAVGHTEDFRGPFDQFMAFFFYIPNLLVVEMFWRGRQKSSSPRMKIAAATALIIATVFLLIGTYSFTAYNWWPAIYESVIADLRL